MKKNKPQKTGYKDDRNRKEIRPLKWLWKLFKGKL